MLSLSLSLFYYTGNVGRSGQADRFSARVREAVCKRLEDGAEHERSALHVTRRYATANWRLDEISADHHRQRKSKSAEWEVTVEKPT